MKVSTRGLYGVLAMFDLALQHRMGPVSVQSVSRRQRISVSYLEQLFNKLRRDGLVESVRGPGGGYRLNRKPKLIKIGDVIRSLEGPLRLGRTRNRATARSVSISEQVANGVWKRIDEGVTGVLDSLTLEDMCEEARKRGNNKEFGHKHMFYI